MYLSQTVEVMRFDYFPAFFTIYLIDAVSGNMVFHCNHKRAKGPSEIVHSENWVVVSKNSYKKYCYIFFFLNQLHDSKTI